MNTKAAAVVVDDDEDLTGLDRGDQPRDDKGRFAKEGGEEEEEEEDAEAKAAADKAAADKAAADQADADKAAADKAAADALAGEGEGDKDDENLPIRLNKMREQRDAERKAAQTERLAREAAEARAAALEEQLKGGKKEEPKPDPAKVINDELDALYEQVETARADGDIKAAAKLQREIDSKNRELTKLEARQVVAETTTKSQIDTRYDTMLDIVEAAIPALDSEHEDYNPKLVKELEFQVAAYEKMGLRADSALRRAVTLIFRIDPFAPKKPDPEPKAADKKDDPPAKPADKKIDLEKAVDTNKRQPPDASNRGVNKDDTKINPKKLTDDEFDALPESKKRDLRGDNG